MAKKAKVVPTTSGVAAGTPLGIQDMSGCSIGLWGTFVMTVQISVSYDPAANSTTFVNVGAPMTAPGTLALPEGALWVQCTTTAYTSGTAFCSVGGIQTT